MCPILTALRCDIASAPCIIPARCSGLTSMVPRSRVMASTMAAETAGRANAMAVAGKHRLGAAAHEQFPRLVQPASSRCTHAATHKGADRALVAPVPGLHRLSSRSDTSAFAQAPHRPAPGTSCRAAARMSPCASTRALAKREPASTQERSCRHPESPGRGWLWQRCASTDLNLPTWLVPLQPQRLASAFSSGARTAPGCVPGWCSHACRRSAAAGVRSRGWRTR